MNLTSSAEQYGFEQGMQQGERTMLKCLLEDKFKEIPNIYRQQIGQADPDTLLKWVRRILNSQTIEEVFKH